jgi:hypothetical protein
MFAVRSAILVLAMGVLSTPVAASPSRCGPSPARDAAFAASDRHSSESTPVMLSLQAPSAFSPLVQRTGRLKAALEESDHDFDEADLGPVHLPDSHNPPASIHFASPPMPTTCRLRC